MRRLAWSVGLVFSASSLSDASSLSPSLSPSSSAESSDAAAPKALVGFLLSPTMVPAPGEANEDRPPLEAPRPPKALWPNEPPKAEAPAEPVRPLPKTGLAELAPRAPNPLGAGDDVLVLDAKLVSLVPPVEAATGDFELAFPKAQNGEADDDAKLPKPEDLNFSALVCGISCAGLAVVAAEGGFEARDANGEDAEVFANPLPGGICPQLAVCRFCNYYRHHKPSCSIPLSPRKVSRHSSLEGACDPAPGQPCRTSCRLLRCLVRHPLCPKTPHESACA